MAQRARRYGREVLEKGYDPALQSFTQSGVPVLDAANLLLPIIGFIDARTLSRIHGG